jgi:hypothetical protein
VSGQVARVESRGRATAALGHGRARAVDSPAFWWSAAVIFLVNAALTSGEGRWLISLLQALTAVWAFVAGVTAKELRTSGRGRRR